MMPIGPATCTALRDDDPETATAIMTNPTAYYVNWHTPAYPAGAIRGQLGD